MSQLQRIQAEVAALPEEELRRFRAWFDSYAANRWDREIESDSEAGKLDTIAAEAVAQYGAGKSKPL